MSVEISVNIDYSKRFGGHMRTWANEIMAERKAARLASKAI